MGKQLNSIGIPAWANRKDALFALALCTDDGGDVKACRGMVKAAVAKTKKGFCFEGPCNKHANNLIVSRTLLLGDKICTDELKLPGKYFPPSQKPAMFGEPVGHNSSGSMRSKTYVEMEVMMMARLWHSLVLNVRLVDALAFVGLACTSVRQEF